jgi:glycosyltransferase involved in cell wall biosynthesis
MIVHRQTEESLTQPGALPAPSADENGPEVSVIMPCLNEADTLAACIASARRALEENHFQGEIIVADNGSTDGSSALAARLGARVVPVEQKGYGHALMGGIAAARGRFIIMGDSDASYDFGEIPKFVAKLREGFDLVQGCRLSSGGGQVRPGAMPWTHRWLGNPMFSLMVRHMFRARGASEGPLMPVHDVYCGLRGFTRELAHRLDQRCTGMEFAPEMIIKSCLFGAKIAEVPITLYPDGRRAHPPHLRTLRDGWRTLRFLLIYSPRWLFLYPGLLLILAGLLGYGIALPGFTIHGVNFDAHTLLFASLALLLGYQSILFGLFTKTFAIGERLLPEDRRLTRFFRYVSLEKGLLAGAAAFGGGLGLLLAAVNQWRLREFGHLDYAYTMRWVIPGVTLTALGFQTVLSSFFISILRMRRR